MRCGWAKRTSSPIAGPGRVLAPVPPTIKGPNRPICSVRSAPNAEPAPPSCCRPATPKLCSFTSMRSNQNHSWRSRYSPPRSSRLAWRQGPPGSKQHLALAAPATRTRTQRPRKYLAIHAAELVVEPNFQILRRYRRSLLLRLEHAHRSAVENHVHRPPRLGSRRSLNLRIGITRLLSSLSPSLGQLLQINVCVTRSLPWGGADVVNQLLRSLISFWDYITPIC